MDASAKFKTALNSVNFFAMWLKQLDDVMTDYKKNNTNKNNSPVYQWRPYVVLLELQSGSE